MKERLENSTYNDVLEERIVRLESLLERGLKAENFGLIPSKYLTFIGDILQKFKMAQGANLNGVEYDDLNAYLNFLSMTNIKHLSIPIDKSITEDIKYTALTTTNQMEMRISIPKGWDGRLSFPFVRLFGSIDKTGVTSEPVIINSNEIATFPHDGWINCIQNKNEIILSTKISDSLLNINESYDEIFLKGYILLWRNA